MDVIGDMLDLNGGHGSRLAPLWRHWRCIGANPSISGKSDIIFRDEAVVSSMSSTKLRAAYKGQPMSDSIRYEPGGLFKHVGDVDVFHVDLIPDQERESEALAWLEGEERSRWQRFRSPVAQRRYVLCRAALRAVLCHEIGCANESLAFVAAEHGKPFAVVDGQPASISFNVSHSGNHGLIAVAPSGCLGVDVEERAPRRNLDNLIEGVFSPKERAEWESLEGRQQLHVFFRFWTIKEALVKAHGKGLSMKVAELEVPEDMRRGATRCIGQFAQIPGTSWRLEDIGTKDFAAAVAHEVRPPS